MKKYLLICVALLLTAAVVTAAVMGSNKKANVAAVKNESAEKKTGECSSAKKAKCAKFASCY